MRAKRASDQRLWGFGLRKKSCLLCRTGGLPDGLRSECGADGWQTDGAVHVSANGKREVLYIGRVFLIVF